MLNFLWRHEVSEQELVRPWSGRPGVVINPSMARLSEGMAWVWREGTSWRGPFEAMWQAPGADDPILLAKAFAAFGFKDTVADPKLWRRGDGLAVAFNSGWDAKQNRLYWAPIWPEIGAPVEVSREGRQAVEKNWGFFEGIGGLQALYGMSPRPSFLQAKSQGAFIPVPAGYTGPSLTHRTIGTQPVHWEGRWYFMAHRRGYLRGKRWYVGELWSFAHEASGYGDVRKEGGPWAHSPWGLLGLGNKRNRNLISCTYFSGLERAAGGGWWVAYGLNDRSAHVAHLNIA